MFQIFRDEPWVTAGILGFMGMSLFVRILLGLLYQNMIRETDNMATTENRLLKQCKLKFANCYQLNNGVSNIPIFVDKFLNRLALGPFSFETLYHLSGQSMLLSVIFAGVGVSRVIVKGRTLGDILPFYIVSFLGLYLYFSISSIVDVKTRKRVLKVNLVDYLENHLSARMDVTESDIEMLYGEAVPSKGSYSRKTANNRSDGRGDNKGDDRNDRSVRNSRNGNKGSGSDRRTVELMPISNGNKNRGETETPVQNLTQYSAQSPAQSPTQDVLSNFHLTVEELEDLIREFC